MESLNFQKMHEMLLEMLNIPSKRRQEIKRIQIELELARLYEQDELCSKLLAAVDEMPISLEDFLGEE